MPRLAPFDLQRGARLRIRGERYSIVDVHGGRPTLSIRADSASHDVVISRSELAALVVQEEATFIDDPEEPETRPSRPVTDISHLPTHRLVDWFAKIFLARKLQRMAGQSPKSAIFIRAYEEAVSALNETFLRFGIVGFKPWSIWTIYHDVLRWRRHSYDFAGLQVKGVEYCPHTSPKEIVQIASELAKHLKKNHPSATTKEIHKQVSKRLSEASGE